MLYHHSPCSITTTHVFVVPPRTRPSVSPGFPAGKIFGWGEQDLCAQTLELRGGWSSRLSHGHWRGQPPHSMGELSGAMGRVLA